MTAARRGAIIGFGNVAEKGHLPGWLEHPDFDIVAVADVSDARRVAAKALLPEARIYSSHDELIAHEALEFVDIASPPGFHREAIVAAAAAGLHVLCEKPVAMTIDDYRPVGEAVDAAGVVLHAVHNWKYSQAFLHLAGILRSGRIGALEHAVFETERNGWSASDDDWRIKRSVAGGGILIDHGWHNFYLLLSLAGTPPTAVRATLEKRRYVDAEIEDTAACEITFPGFLAEVRLTWAAPLRRTRWTLRGARGRIVIDDDVVETESGVERATEKLSAGLSAGSYHADWFPGVIRSFQEEIDDPAVRGRNRLEAEWCLALLDRAYASARQAGCSLPVIAAAAAYH
jgi:predicted dehydrogenase